MEAHEDNIAGSLFEPTQGEARIVVSNENYLTQIRYLCDK